MVSCDGFGAIWEPKAIEKSIKTELFAKVPTCVPIGKYHIELKVDPLRIEPKIDKNCFEILCGSYEQFLSRKCSQSEPKMS